MYYYHESSGDEGDLKELMDPILNLHKISQLKIINLLCVSDNI